MIARALTAMLPLAFAACSKPPEAPAPALPSPVAAPEVPADLRLCFVGLTDVPDRALTAGDVERLWKDDRKRAAAMARCGRRLLAWIDAVLPGVPH